MWLYFAVSSQWWAAVSTILKGGGCDAVLGVRIIGAGSGCTGL